MALTVTPPVGPESWMPLGDSVNYTLSSTQTNQPGFYFLIDVVLNGNNVVTLRRFPITGNSIVLNLHDIVQPFLKSSTNEITVDGSFSPSDYVQLYISVTEFYSGQTYDTATSNPIYIWGATPDFQWEKNNSYLSNYIGTYAWKFNLIPASGYYSTRYKGEPMAYHNTFSGTIFNIINTIGSRPYAKITNQAIQNSYHFCRGMNHKFTFFNGSFSSKVYNNVYVVMCGFAANGIMIKKAYTYFTSYNAYYTNTISTTSATGWPYKSGDFSDWNDCKYFVFYLASAANTTLTNIDTIITKPVVMSVCDSDEFFAITYKSKDGSWGIIQANQKVTESTEVKYTTKEDLKPTALNYSSTMRSVVNVQANSIWTLNTDWVSEGINEDIKDMILSPIQYIIHYKNGSTDYIPVVLSDTSFVTKEYGHNKLFNYKFTFAESYYKNTIKQ